MFADRHDAARQLLERLPKVDPADSVILALPRGGVPIGAVLAMARGIPLDPLQVRKIGAPGQPELAIGAVGVVGADAEAGGGMQIWVNRDVALYFGLDEVAVRRLAENEMPELERRRALYLGGRRPATLTGKTVIVVDDGLATGATARAALRLVALARPKRTILAIPVAPATALSDLAPKADEIICVETPADFIAVGAHYRDFAQVNDDEVVTLVRKAQEATGAPG